VYEVSGFKTPTTLLHRGAEFHDIPATMRSIVNNLLRWFRDNARDLPWRRTLDPYAIWVSEIMLQQTQVSTVVPYWERWMRELPDIQSLARASEQKILKLWEGLGYYTRARNLHRAAKSLNGRLFPRDYENILNLPGIGRYTAGAICSIAFNQPTPVLDGNVRRVLSRLFATHEDLWDIAQALVSIAARTKSPRSCSALNQALMELGAVVCTAREPRCDECPVATMCRARRFRRTEDFPARVQRASAIRRRFAAYVYHYKGRYLVRQRPNKVVNARLWEFPNVEIVNGTPMKKQTRPFSTFKHTIMHYRIAVEAFLINKKPKIVGKWLTLARLDQLPFSSAHRKILIALRTKNAV
jgi:A/G-specific adenine glycosylase